MIIRKNYTTQTFTILSQQNKGDIGTCKLHNIYKRFTVAVISDFAKSDFEINETDRRLFLASKVHLQPATWLTGKFPSRQANVHTLLASWGVVIGQN